jgi:hypothetical protein
MQMAAHVISTDEVSTCAMRKMTRNDSPHQTNQLHHKPLSPTKDACTVGTKYNIRLHIQMNTHPIRKYKLADKTDKLLHKDCQDWKHEQLLRAIVVRRVSVGGLVRGGFAANTVIATQALNNPARDFVKGGKR